MTVPVEPNDAALAWLSSNDDPLPPISPLLPPTVDMLESLASYDSEASLPMPRWKSAATAGADRIDKSLSGDVCDELRGAMASKLRTGEGVSGEPSRPGESELRYGCEGVAATANACDEATTESMLTLGLSPSESEMTIVLVLDVDLVVSSFWLRPWFLPWLDSPT